MLLVLFHQGLLGKQRLMESCSPLKLASHWCTVRGTCAELLSRGTPLRKMQGSSRGVWGQVAVHVSTMMLGCWRGCRGYVRVTCTMADWVQCRWKWIVLSLRACLCHELISLSALDFQNIRPCEAEPPVAQNMAKKGWQHHCLIKNPGISLSAVKLVNLEFCHDYIYTENGGSLYIELFCLPKPGRLTGSATKPANQARKRHFCRASSFSVKKLVGKPMTNSVATCASAESWMPYACSWSIGTGPVYLPTTCKLANHIDL